MILLCKSGASAVSKREEQLEIMLVKAVVIF